jgi:hypothetical protein
MPQPPQSPFPPIPAESVQEGARWRHRRPSGEAVAAWFATQPLDEGMDHEDYVGGVVLIPGGEKVKYPTDKGSVERYEIVFVPYMQIGTRVAYFRRLAEHRGLIPWIGPAEVPRSSNPASHYFNANMPAGLWWHVVVGGGGDIVRYLCASYVVRMYREQDYGRLIAGQLPMPVLEGSGTKQVSGGVDPNGLMKAQTGAIGRALGVAGILVVGTGIATAEDMAEYSGDASSAPGPDAAQLPPTAVPAGRAPAPVDPAQALEALQAQAMALQVRMTEENPAAWHAFTAWWVERRDAEGWRTLRDVPAEALRGVVARMERALATTPQEEAAPAPPTPDTANEPTGDAA